MAVALFVVGTLIITACGGGEATPPPAPTPTTVDGRTFLSLTGSGLGAADYGLLGFSPRPSIAGGEPGDLGDGQGLIFDAKGSNVEVIVNTVAGLKTRVPL